MILSGILTELGVVERNVDDAEIKNEEASMSAYLSCNACLLVSLRCDAISKRIEQSVSNHEGTKP
jgi:hypothetical protein